MDQIDAICAEQFGNILEFHCSSIQCVPSQIFIIKWLKLAKTNLLELSLYAVRDTEISLPSTFIKPVFTSSYKFYE
jgi:hypothetical protein